MFKNTTRWEKKMVKIGHKIAWGRESRDPLVTN